MRRELHIGGIAVGDHHPYFVVAEIGHNHQGDPELARHLKKIVAARDLPDGHVLVRADLAVRSPGDGMSPHLLDHVLGQRLQCELRRDDDLSTAAIEPPSPRP